MRRKICLFISIIMVLSMLMIPVFAAVPVTPLDPDLVMYANDFTVGEIVAVNFDPYNPLTQVSRINPTNALGAFDAIAPAGVSDFFFATNARTWSRFTFENKFMNVDGAPDIEFAEVTWGNGGSWHTEAMKVYLTGTYVEDSGGNVVPYGTADDGIGYYAGIAWNRIGLEYVDAADRLIKTQSYFLGSRDFADNVFYRSGDYGTYTQFHLPDEVVYAEGIHLVDITKEVYDLAYPATYLEVSGTGALVTLNSDDWDAVNTTKITADNVIAISGSNGNTDGYDLDAIRVYKYVPPTYDLCGYKLDTDTGLGLEGWTIILRDLSGKEVTRTVTGSGGRYCFSGLLAGTYTVEEVEEEGWEQVFPGGNGKHEVTLPKEDVVYGIQRFTGKIFEVNPLTAAATEYFDITLLPETSVGPNGLAFDQMTGDLYFTTYRGLAKLYVTDDPVEEYLGELPGEIACADFFDGKYYYIAGGTASGFGGPTDDLYEVTFDENGDIAGWTKFGDISGEYNSKWTFDGDIAISSDGVIYGFGKDNNTGGGYEFFKVNRDGTDFEMIKDSGYTFSLQLAFSGDGVLYGHDAVGGRFFAVDTDDGSIELISTNSKMLYTDAASGTLSYNFENKYILGEVPAFKFYDANLNGVFDEGEEPIGGWKIGIFDGDTEIESKLTDMSGEVMFTVPYGEYTIKEIMPFEKCWIATTPMEQTVTVERLETAERVEFGNVCLGEGGGKTLGFWSNKNGMKIFLGDDSGISSLALLSALNLKDADGHDFDPISYDEFRAWLLGGTATNMSYMLSVQVAAMKLNVTKGLVDADALIYVPTLTDIADGLGFASVNAVLVAADEELFLHGTAFSEDEWRGYQEDLKNALDYANNNMNFLQSGPCSVTY